MNRLEGRVASGPIGEQHADSTCVPQLDLQMPPSLASLGKSGTTSTFQTSYEADRPSSRNRMRQKYNDIRDEERKKNDLLNFAHRSVQRDTARQIGLSSGEISKAYGRSPRRSPPRRKVYIQNSSALVKREQELLKRPALAREGSVGTTITRSLTATTVSLSDLTLTEVPDDDSTDGVEDDKGKQGEAQVKPSIEDACVQALSDGEEYDNEEESSDDEREWRKDSHVLNTLPHVGLRRTKSTKVVPLRLGM